jgi:glyoxylase-like metal-dependent hydrolase (beta-lactamase superfamily II)
MLQTRVADGVHRAEDADTNWYLVQDGNRLTVVDAGVPASWESFRLLLQVLGRRIADVEAIVLTHAHFDHVGFAETLRRAAGIPVYLHRADETLAYAPMAYAHERSRLWYLPRPKAMPIVGRLLLARAFFPPPLGEVQLFDDGDVLPVPGAPQVLATPGHTDGHCALLLAERGVLIAGDAVVTLDPYTGRRGPRLVARAATADSERAQASLQRIAESGAQTVLMGHGEPWTGGPRELAAQAASAGSA